MAIRDGRTLVPDDHRHYLGIDADPLKLDVADLAQYDRDWLLAVRAEVDKRRAEVWSEMRRITAKAGDRTPTRNQQVAFDDGESDLSTLTALRDRLNDAMVQAPGDGPTASEQRARSERVKQDVRETPTPSARTGRTDYAMTSTVPTQGALLAPETRMTDHLRAKGRIRDDDPHLDAGKVLRGIVLGRWDGAEAERRAMAEGSGASGGYLVPTILSSEVIDLARNASRVFEAGARLFPMDSQIENVPRQITDPTPSWRLENAQIQQSGPTFDMVTFTARSLACITVLSRELLEDAKQNIDALVKQAIGKAIALEIDRVALRGSGSAPEPQGLRGTNGVPITSLGTNGAAATWDNLSTSVQTVRGNNFEPSGVIFNPRTAGGLARTKDTQGRYLNPPADIAGLPLLPTNQIQTNLTQGTSNLASDIYVGDWSQLWVGTRTELTLTVLTERYADFGQIGIVAWWRGDVQVAHPLAFNVLTGAL